MAEPQRAAVTDYLADSRALLAHASDAAIPRCWLDTYWDGIAGAFARNGHTPRFEAALAALPPPSARALCCADSVFLGAATADVETRRRIRDALAELGPWRKGPFDFAGVTVDAEWRCDRKWRRVAAHVTPLDDRRVLDVGCGNGYYLWQMIAQGARLAVGLDPSVPAIAQFRAARSFAPPSPVTILPAGGEILDRGLHCFDTVFSMGVLYHRRDPLAHLRDLRRALSGTGELVLETLVIDEPGLRRLTPPARYARMRNIGCIPTPAQVIAWIGESGFDDARCVDVTRTTSAEQRSTAWMPYQSLRDFLDPVSAARTIEGYPAPVRAIFLARAVN